MDSAESGDRRAWIYMMFGRPPIHLYPFVPREEFPSLICRGAGSALSHSPCFAIRPFAIYYPIGLMAGDRVLGCHVRF